MGTSIPGMLANPLPSSGTSSLSAWRFVGVGGDYVPRVPPWACPIHDRCSSPVCLLTLLTAEFWLQGQCTSPGPQTSTAQLPTSDFLQSLSAQRVPSSLELALLYSVLFTLLSI